jgi:hypothetical protein
MVLLMKRLSAFRRQAKKGEGATYILENLSKTWLDISASKHMQGNKGKPISRMIKEPQHDVIRYQGNTHL